jgi:hypothetical protein
LYGCYLKAPLLTFYALLHQTAGFLLALSPCPFFPIEGQPLLYHSQMTRYSLRTVNNRTSIQLPFLLVHILADLSGLFRTFLEDGPLGLFRLDPHKVSLFF